TSDEVVTDEIASDDYSLDMTDFKDLVGVSDDEIVGTSDEISEISEVKGEISKVATIAETSDEIVGTSDEISEISEVAGIAEASDEIVTDEIASDDGIAKTSDEVASGDDEFAGISESDLAGALGLDIAGLSSQPQEPKEQTNNADIEQVKSQISSQITETIGATLASSPALKEAIKGMKIKINISFEE
ncbi:MAG: hypothetical protein SPE37_03950, partial [Campylobacter sp.]|nr:hypothetical protein [Campylobacter sp.]